MGQPRWVIRPSCLHSCTAVARHRHCPAAMYLGESPASNSARFADRVPVYSKLLTAPRACTLRNLGWAWYGMSQGYRYYPGRAIPSSIVGCRATDRIGLQTTTVSHQNGKNEGFLERFISAPICHDLGRRGVKVVRKLKEQSCDGGATSQGPRVPGYDGIVSRAQ